MKIKLKNELIEYLIYLLKSYNDENSSVTELKYENLIKILNDENYGKPDELDLEEEEAAQNQQKEKNSKKKKNSDKNKNQNSSDNEEELPNRNNDSDESGIEITTEEYLKIVEGILIELTNKMYQKKLTLEEIFQPFITELAYKEKNLKVNILELKYLVNILHDELEINLDSVDIYCLFTKFKVDENETEEIIDFDKFVNEINILIADPNAFFLKIKMEKEENNFKNFNDKNNLENLGKNKTGINNNLDTFTNMNNANIMTSVNNNNMINQYELQMKMNSLDYLRTFLRENKIEFENLIQPLTDHFKKNNFSGDIYIDLNLFDEYLESKNLFARTEFIENLPEIFSNESIRMALLTKDNKLNLSFLKQILDECGSEEVIDFNQLPNEVNNIQNVHVDQIKPKQKIIE